jgi:hypothetical protein
MELLPSKAKNTSYNYVKIIISGIIMREIIGNSIKPKVINIATIIKIYKFKDLEIVPY